MQGQSGGGRGCGPSECYIGSITACSVYPSHPLANTSLPRVKFGALLKLFLPPLPQPRPHPLLPASSPLFGLLLAGYKKNVYYFYAMAPWHARRAHHPDTESHPSFYHPYARHRLNNAPQTKPKAIAPPSPIPLDPALVTETSQESRLVSSR